MSLQEIKGNLARLLATENLVVEHRNCSTAQFNVDTRVLTLPNWDYASNIVYDLLVGHEVGHALFTPNEDWTSVADCPMDYVNVVEDARIEKLMKRKYPGLRKSFSGGYTELNDEDFFDIKDSDISKYTLIDRINLHCKIGANAMIPFEQEEKQFVTRTENSETFEEVLKISVDIYNFCKENTPEENPINDIEQQNDTVGSSGDAGNGSSDVESNEDGEGTYDSPSSSGTQSVSHGEGGETADLESKTQKAFDTNSEKFINKYHSNSTYVEIPESITTSDYVADWEEVHNWIDEQRNSYIAGGDGKYREDRSALYNDVDNAYKQFRKQSNKEVNYLVKEFECRKSADAYARSGQSKSGVLDTANLHTYKYNEDLFKKVTVVPDGKNHGLLFLLDWSGSMQSEILATVKQLLNLTAFCKKVQIPFEVYAFTNEYHVVRRSLGYYDQVGNENYFSKICKENKIFLSKGMFHLMNFISSRSNSKNYERMCLNLFREAYSCNHYVGYRNTIGVGLSGTPLNEAVILLNYLIPEFKTKNDLQKVNVCILTDGESCTSAYGRKFYNDHTDESYVRPRRIDGCILRDRQTGITYSKFEGWGGNTNVFVRQLRDRNPGVNVIGFRIGTASQLSAFVSTYGNSFKYLEVQRQWKKEKSAIIPEPKAFTALYAISSNALNISSEFEVETGAKKGEIAKAFKKMLSSKSTNKKLLNSFIQYVA
tara:strand:- start:13434 stop:15569 length:2136 start_codon:yes stop_codon:yes gene_type:complete